MRFVEATYKRPPSKHNGAWVDVKVQGVFHQWGCNYEEFDNGPGNYTVGIIELDSGKIIEVLPETMHFIHAPHDRPKD